MPLFPDVSLHGFALSLQELYAARVVAKRREACVKAEATRKLSKLCKACVNQRTISVNVAECEAPRACVSISERETQKVAL